MRTKRSLPYHYPIGSFQNHDNPRRIDLTNLLGMDLVHRADGTVNSVAVPQVETVSVRDGTRLIRHRAGVAAA